MAYNLVEIKAFNTMTEASFRQQFTAKELHIFRYELAILLDERKASTHREGDFYMQDVDYICDEIRKRLEVNHAWDMTRQQIKRMLRNVSNIIKAKLANNEDISALDFTTKAYQKKVGRKPKPPKAGRKRKVVITENGVSREFESISQAAQVTGYGYGYIKHNSMAAWRDENSL